MIEKEVIIKSEDGEKISMFLVKADNINAYFEEAHEICDKLNLVTDNKYGFKVDYSAIYNLRKINIPQHIKNTNSYQ